MELQDKIIRFGKIAEEADHFRARVWRRFNQAGLRILWDRELGKAIAPHLDFQQDLFRIDLPPEIGKLLEKSFTDEERKSPYAAITLARFSLPTLAQYTIGQLQLNPDELDALESIVKARAEALKGPSMQKFVVVALALLSWLCSDIPDEVLVAWGVDKARFIPAAFYIGVGGVAFALLMYAMEIGMKSRLNRQDALTAELIVYCRAQLKAGAAANPAGISPPPAP